MFISNSLGLKLYDYDLLLYKPIGSGQHHFQEKVATNGCFFEIKEI